LELLFQAFVILMLLFFCSLIDILIRILDLIILILFIHCSLDSLYSLHYYYVYCNILIL